MLNMPLIALLSSFAQEDPKLDHVVQSLTKSSIELAEAASNYGALKVIFGIFMVMVLVMVVMFVYTIWNLNKKVTVVSESSQQVKEFFDGAADSTIGITEAQILIRREFNCLGHILKYAILRIRFENHIDNKESTVKKVESLVNNEYSELCGLLSNFTCNGKSLSNIFEPQDNEAIKDMVIEQIYIPKDQFTISNMDQSVGMYLNGLKLIYLKNYNMARRLLPIIDFAHGSDVAGKQSPDGRHKEYLWSRKVGKMLAERLKREGFEVAFTNTKDTEIGLSRRKEIANNLDAPRGGTKFLLSLHNNAAGMGNEWCAARGFEICTTKGQTRSDLFATVIFEQLQEDFPTTDGYKHRTDPSDGDPDKEANFTVLMGNNYWGVLLEWLFQDNPDDVALLEDDSVNRELVESLTKALIFIDENLDKLKI